jgi:PEP-CTERM motif
MLISIQIILHAWQTNSTSSSFTLSVTGDIEMNLNKCLAAVAVSALCMAGTSHADLIQNGNGTFKDTATGYLWQDISTFWDMNTSEMNQRLKPGFHFASFAELLTLQDAAPAVPSRFFDHAEAMGTSQPTLLDRNIIWGVYGDLTRWSWKFDTDTEWKFDTAGITRMEDLGAYAVNTSPIPEPETYAMLLAGLGLLGFAARRRKAKAAV